MQFVESRLFIEDAQTLIGEEGLRKLQNDLARNPDAGDVIPAAGGLRKIRVDHPGRSKGKRGGCRVVYLHTREALRIDLIAIYSKGEKDDLSASETRVLKTLAIQLRRDAISRSAKKGRKV